MNEDSSKLMTAGGCTAIAVIASTGAANCYYEGSIAGLVILAAITIGCIVTLLGIAASAHKHNG